MKLVIHNTLSLDSAYFGFDIDLEHHYGILMGLQADAILVGSDTVVSAYQETPEEDSDKRKQTKPGPSYYMIDTRGKSKGMLHLFRRMPYISDITVIVSKTTPPDYLKYLEEREYEMILCGDDHADLRELKDILSKKHKLCVTDTGGVLASLLIDQGVADELSLVVEPVLSPGNPHFFSSLKSKHNLKLNGLEQIGGRPWVRFSMH